MEQNWFFRPTMGSAWATWRIELGRNWWMSRSLTVLSAP